MGVVPYPLLDQQLSLHPMCTSTYRELDIFQSFKENTERKMELSESVEREWTKNTGPHGPSVKRERSLALHKSRADSCCSLVETIFSLGPD